METYSHVLLALTKFLLSRKNEEVDDDGKEEEELLGNDECGYEN